ncbi:Spy/CpxP family protein refolding chaperone [Paracraurococcus ruber]|nr:Spy/CpxP family protein refolding chaperone [Paracraurococcus ruber]
MQPPRRPVGQAVVLATSLALIAEIMERQDDPACDAAADLAPAGPRAVARQVRPAARRAAPLQPFRRLDGQLEMLRQDLAITPPQQAAWEGFAAAARANAAALQAAARRSGRTPPPAPEALERRARLAAVQLEAARRLAAAMVPLYDALSEAQRRTADALLAEDAPAPRLRWL